TDLLGGLVSDLPAQRLSPEPRETERIVRIDAERNEPERHPAPQHRSPGATTITRFVDAGLVSPNAPFPRSGRRVTAQSPLERGGAQGPHHRQRQAQAPSCEARQSARPRLPPPVRGRRAAQRPPAVPGQV